MNETNFFALKDWLHYITKHCIEQLISTELFTFPEYKRGRFPITFNHIVDVPEDEDTQEEILCWLKCHEKKTIGTIQMTLLNLANQEIEIICTISANNLLEWNTQNLKEEYQENEEDDYLDM